MDAPRNYKKKRKASSSYYSNQFHETTRKKMIKQSNEDSHAFLCIFKGYLSLLLYLAFLSLL